MYLTTMRAEEYPAKNGINLNDVYGHSVEGATGQEALEAVEVRPFVVWDNATLAVAY